MTKKLIIGLGNIGLEYDQTRHNIGFDIANAFVKKHGGSWRIDRLAEVCELKVKGRLVFLIKPTTYMNLSGRAFKYWQEKEKIAISDTLTLVDDMALPLDKLRLRPSGSHAGHNGLKDIELAIGHSIYPRLRFGIGNDFPKGKQVDFVLGKWEDSEVPIVKLKIDACVSIIETFVFQGIEPAMNLSNAKKF